MVRPRLAEVEGVLLPRLEAEVAAVRLPLPAVAARLLQREEAVVAVAEAAAPASPACGLTVLGDAAEGPV